MTIPATVLVKTEEAARHLAHDVVEATQALQEAAQRHLDARALQDRLAGELNELADFLDHHHHQNRSNWSSSFWGPIYDHLATLPLVDAGMLGLQSERELEALANPAIQADASAIPAAGTHEHPIFVQIDGRPYPTVIDALGQQRFVPNKVLVQLLDLARHNGVITVESLRAMSENGHYSVEDFRAFVAQTLELTVAEFQAMFPNVVMNNPMQPDDDSDPSYTFLTGQG